MTTNLHSAGDSESTSSSPSNEAPLKDVKVRLDSILVNDVFKADSGHEEVILPPLSETEQFFVDVANVFTKQQNEENAKKLKSHTLDNKSEYINIDGHIFAQSDINLLHLQRIQQSLNNAKFQCDNMVSMLDKLMKGTELTVTECSNISNPNEDVDQQNDQQNGSMRADDEKKLTADQQIHLNRHLLMLSAKQDQYAQSADSFSRARQELIQNIDADTDFQNDLQFLTSKWLIRHKIIHGHSQLQVDYRIGDMGLIYAGRIQNTGRIRLVRNETGKLHIADDESCIGGEKIHQRLTEKQHQLVYQHIYNTILHEARHLSHETLISQYSAEVDSTATHIVVECFVFSRLELSFHQRENGPFVVKQLSQEDNLQLVNKIIRAVLKYYMRNALCNQPLLLSRSYNEFNDIWNWRESPPHLLNMIFVTINHQKLVAMVQQKLKDIVSDQYKSDGWSTDQHVLSQQDLICRFRVLRHSKPVISIRVYGTSIIVQSLHQQKIECESLIHFEVIVKRAIMLLMDSG